MKISITAKLAELNERMARDAQLVLGSARVGEGMSQLTKAMQGIAGALALSAAGFRNLEAEFAEYQARIERERMRVGEEVHRSLARLADRFDDAALLARINDARKREHEARKRARRRRG